MSDEIVVSPEHDAEIAKDMARFNYDPYGFAMYAFKWGEPGTILADFPDGPVEWQRETLIEIGQAMLEDKASGKPTRILRRSGHEIGKTALIAMIIIWFVATHKDGTGVVTANTKSQLDTKTWREVRRWLNACILDHWFTYTATRLCVKGYEKTWGVNAIPWSKEKSQAFAGMHEKVGGVLMIFDEASIIADEIWEVADTQMDAGALWLAFGNPTENTGMFKEAAVGRYRHRWRSRAIDSRTSPIANQTRIQEWIEDKGEDSDYVRIRVKGEFPTVGPLQFIPTDVVDEAAGKHLAPEVYDTMPKVLGVDCARYGDDQSVIARRQGQATTKLVKYSQLNAMELVGKIELEIEAFQPKVVFIDTGNIGGGVVDRLRQLGYDNIIEVVFGGKPDDITVYANKRAEMWGRMKDWLVNGGAIPDDDELKADLIGPEYKIVTKRNHDVIQLEPKEEMKNRGLASPDSADAIACTFCYKVPARGAQKHLNTATGRNPMERRNQHGRLKRMRILSKR